MKKNIVYELNHKTERSVLWFFFLSKSVRYNVNGKTVLAFRGIRDSKKFSFIILRFPGYFNGIFYHKCLKISTHIFMNFLISISSSKYQISDKVFKLLFS